MTNNEILRRIRHTFDLDDSKMIAIFGLAGLEVTAENLVDWLKEDDVLELRRCKDIQLATFLNGWIIDRRGPKDGPQPEPEEHLTNNIIFNKLKIALNLKAEEVLEILGLTNFKLGKHELSAFFRKPTHKHYRDCHDQIFLRFLEGLDLKYRTQKK